MTLLVAFAEDGNLFVLARLSMDAPPIARLEIDIAGQVTDLTAHHRREGALVLAARALGTKLRIGAAIRLRIDALPPLAGKLTRDRAVFDPLVASHDGLLTALLHGAGRPEAYALEATAWPESAAREERADLAQLGRDLRLDIDFCCVPVPGVLLLVAWLDDPARRLTAVDVFHGEDDTPFARGLHRITRPDGPPDAPGRLRPSEAIVLTLAFDESVVTDDDFVLLLATRTALWTRTLRPQRGQLERGLRFLDQQLGRFDANTRMLMLEELLARSPPGTGETAILQAMLAVAVAALPEELTRVELGVRLALDLACTVGHAGVFLLGWALFDPADVPAIEFRTAGGARHEISREWVGHSRLDVWRRLREQAVHARSDRLGFLCFVPMPVVPETATGYLLLRWRDSAILRMRITLYFSAEDPLDAIKPMLTSFAQTHHDLKRLLDRHIGPAVSAIWSTRRGRATAVDVLALGQGPARPEASVVVPLYGRYDFLEFQVAAFADDPDMRAHELIYVVDDPLIYDEARLLAQESFLIYGVPLRLVYGRRNLGFSGATNLGASLARGRCVLMMNSDVMPRQPGWLSALVAAADRLPDAGAIAPVLLYDDGSLQHAGMVFARYPLWADMYVNEHPGKGLPPLPMPAPFEAIAVTGACLLMQTALWQELGGLSDEFIIGDFEDSDLCMRLRARGRRNWVVPSVTLTHLERQSQDLIGEPAWRTNLTLLNCWTHDRKWHAAIDETQGGGA